MTETHARIDAAYLSEAEFSKVLKRLKKHKDVYVHVLEMPATEMQQRNECLYASGKARYRVPDYRLSDTVYFVELFAPINQTVRANRLQAEVDRLTKLLKEQA